VALDLQPVVDGGGAGLDVQPVTREDLVQQTEALRGTPTSAKIYGALGAVGDGIQWGFKKINWALASVPATVADVAEGWADRQQDIPSDATPEQIPGGFRNLKAWYHGAQTRQQPTYQEIDESPEVQDSFWANVGQKVSRAGSDLLPRLYVMRGLGAAGAGPATAGAAAFAPSEEGFSGVGAVTGAAIPALQQVGKVATGAVLSKMGGGALPGAAQKAIEEMGGLASIQAFNEAMQVPEKVRMYQENPQQFWHQLAADTVVNLGFLALSVPGWKGGAPSETQQILDRQARPAAETPLPNGNLAVEPFETPIANGQEQMAKQPEPILPPVGDELRPAPVEDPIKQAWRQRDWNRLQDRLEKSPEHLETLQGLPPDVLSYLSERANEILPGNFEAWVERARKAVTAEPSPAPPNLPALPPAVLVSPAPPEQKQDRDVLAEANAEMERQRLANKADVEAYEKDKARRGGSLTPTEPAAPALDLQPVEQSGQPGAEPETSPPSSKAPVVKAVPGATGEDILTAGGPETTKLDIRPVETESETGATNERATEQLGQQPTGTPGVDVRESARPGARLGADGKTATTPGREEPASAASGGPAEAGTGDELRGGVRGGAGQRARPGGRPSDAGQRPGPGAVEGTGGDLQAARTESDVNHILPAGEDWIPSGDKAKVRANLDAIKLLKQLEAEGRNPTADEKAVLARYTGWGGLKEIFDEGKAAYRERAPWNDEQKREAANWERNWGKSYDEVNSALTPEEHAAAAKSILNAHFTSREVINAVWKGAQRLGFKGGRALEPAAGIGHFIGLTPEVLRGKVNWSAVELDSISGRIAQKLYPQARVYQTGFQDAKIAPNSQDFVVSNFPFAKDGPTDKRYPRLSLHNYFFARALDVVKPGGIVAAITSDSTMDSPSSQAAREYLAGKADLVGAIRLPNTAFKKNAGTEVTTDVLYFRKRDGTPFQGADFKRVVPGETYKGEPIELNEYFAKHPEMMMGRMSKEGTMYGPDQQALVPTPGADLNRQLEEAIGKLPANVMGGAAVPQGVTAAPATPFWGKGAKVGSLQVANGKPGLVGIGGESEAVSWASDSKKVRQAADYVSVRDTAQDLIRKQLSTESTDAEIAEGRKALNKAYDAYVKKYGAINERRSKFLDDDVDFPLALALEDKDSRIVELPGGKAKRQEFYTKSKLFTERTIFPRVAPERVDTVADGLQVSQNFAGKVDPDYIAKLTGRAPDAVKQELEQTGQAFENPATGQWENRATYLSGFVKDKLKAAQAAAESDPRYARQVAELAKVQPPPIAIENIGVKLGSVFVPENVVEAFLRDKLNVDARVSFVPQTGDWRITPRAGYEGEKNKTLYGVHDWKGHELVEQSLNLKSAIVTRIEGTGKDAKEVKDPAKSLEAQQKQDTLQKEFKQYVLSNPEVARAIEQIYNDRYNGVVAPKFEAPTWAHYPGASTDIQLYEHQKAVVTRMLQNSTLLAHAVGTGKTFAMTTAAMEMRRLGLAKKPMIVVQNATLEQFARSFKRLYPTARILSPNAKMRDATNRNKTMSRIATGDWDAVIVPQSFVNMLPDDPAREAGYIQDRLAELQSAKIEAANTEGKRSPKAADLQRAIDRLQTRLDSLSDRKKDNVLTFEQLGVDALFVDEAHAYKKLEFSTKMDNIKGLDTGASQRGWSMNMKTRWVQEKNQGRNVVFATGTPVSNTIAEAWNMMRYVRPDVLKAYDIEKFDDFASTFGDTVTQLEMTPGGTWKPVTRFARYTNGPELIAAWRTVADVVTPEEVNLPNLPALKNGKTTVHTIPQSPALHNYVGFLRSELERFANMSGKEKRENSHIPLVVFGLAKKASLDMRMIDPTLADQPGSKLNVAADTIAQTYRDSGSVKGAQLVFSDAFQDNPDHPRFNLYQEVKKKLIERGVPEHEIAIITSEIKDARREALFTKVNDGDLRVVLGSTERMGVGVNAQEHLVALHHLDAPARPMDIEQRNGRIIRQGNQNPEVEVHSYGVENTLDAAMFQKLATKQRFINQILRGDLQGRNFEDAANEQSLSFDEQMAAFSGDKRAMEKVGLENQVRQLQMLRSGHFEQLRKARDTIAQLQERTIPYQTKQVAEAQRRAAVFAQAFGPEKDYTLSLNGKTIAGRKEVAAALDHYFKEEIASTIKEARGRRLFGDLQAKVTDKLALNGQPLDLAVLATADAKGIVNPDSAKVEWKFADGGEGGQSTTGVGFYHSLAASLERVAGSPEFHARSLANEQRNLRELSGFIQQPFEREAELNTASAKLDALTAELEAEGRSQAEEARRRADIAKTKPANLSGAAETLIKAAADMRGKAARFQPGDQAERNVRSFVEDGINQYSLPQAEADYVCAVTFGKLSSEEAGAGEVEHGMAGTTRTVAPRISGAAKPLTAAVAAKPANAVMQDINRFRTLMVPQTMGDPARFTGDLLRELNAKMANEMARADATLRPFRNDFDRTPVPKRWKYDPTLPLPRNLAFVDAYEGGSAAGLGPAEAKVALEFQRMNEAWVDRVHALGTGALQTLVQNYFPHIWDNPAKARQVIAATLGKRPLEGPKSFLKQRTHELFRDGLAAGLKPVHDNPVDQFLLKKREVERYILAHQFTSEMKEAGLAKFVHAFSKAPEGWSTVKDRAFEVYGPPTVTIKEAFDAGMRQKTLEVLDHLGVPFERRAKIRGQRWGFERDQPGVPGTEKITTKFSGPDSVIWHELGHALDNRYRDLQPAMMGPESEQRQIASLRMRSQPLPATLERTAKLGDELRSLADLRFEGETPSPSFRRGVRSTAEKMATVLQAYLHAPERMREVAPTVYDAFRQFIANHPELEEINDIRPGLRLGQGETELPVGGLVKLGNYYMPEAAARVVNNYLSPGFNPHLWYRTLRETSHLMNAAQLGLSAFHLGFTSLDAAVSRLAAGIEDLAHGDLGRAVRTVPSALVAPLTNIRLGARVRAGVMGDTFSPIDRHLLRLKSGIQPADIQQIVKALEAGGGRVAQDAFYQTEFSRRMARAFHEGTATGYVQGVVQAPFALVEQLMRPIMEYVVPRQKLGVFADLARREIERLGRGYPGGDAQGVGLGGQPHGADCL
jgi:N12 class adenine-specific DNA methylase